MVHFFGAANTDNLKNLDVLEKIVHFMKVEVLMYKNA